MHSHNEKDATEQKAQSPHVEPDRSQTTQRVDRPPKRRRRRQPPTLEVAVENYLSKRKRKVDSDELSGRTYKTDRRSLKLLVEWTRSEYGPLPVTDIDATLLRDFKEHRLRSVSPTTTAKNLRHIKSFFSDLVQRDLVDSNPAKRVSIPKTRRRDLVPKRSELLALKKWLDKQIEGREEPEMIHLLMKLACNTGMRLGELIRIKWERGPKDIGTGHSRNYVYLNSEEKTLTIKFKRKLRVIPVGHVWDIFEILRKRTTKGQQYVFASPNGGHYDDSYICHRWKKEIKQADGLTHPYTSHAIRHAVVTFLLQEGYSTHKVGKLVGHSSAQITERYAHLLASDLNEMVGDLSGGDQMYG